MKLVNRTRKKLDWIARGWRVKDDGDGNDDDGDEKKDKY